MITFAVISDVHGNSWALRAVLKDIERRQITRIVNLGDTLYGPLDPAGTAEILLEKNMPTVQGNEDRIISKNSHASSLPTLAYVQDNLSEHHYQWLASLPATLCWENTFMCHASPHSDTEYLLWEISAEGAALRRANDVVSRLASVDLPLILCGHDHMPRIMQLPQGVLVVNPGSVGLPAYSDDRPFPHVMETGSPHARYALISQAQSGWLVEDIAVPYAWQAAEAQALRNDRPDWAEWLRTGQAVYG